MESPNNFDSARLQPRTYLPKLSCRNDQQSTPVWITLLPDIL